MNLLKRYFNNLTVFNFLVTQVLVHVIFGTSFTNTIFHEFEISKEVKNFDIFYSSYNVDTPVFHILGSIIGLEDFRYFAVMVFLVTNIVLYFICYNIAFLDENSVVFLFSGWLVTVSWFMGYVDVFTVLLTVLIFKSLFLKHSKKETIFYAAFLTFNHYGIALFIILIFLVLIFDTELKKFTKFLVFGYLSGRIILEIYLTIVNYNGRSRFRFVFNDNVLDQVFYLSSSNSLDLILSGFLGVLVYLIIYIYYSNSLSKSKIVVSLSIALIGCSLALDTSRVFSMLVLPLNLYLLKNFEKIVKFENLQLKKFLPFVAFIFMIFIDERHLFGSVFTESPNYENTISIYSLVTEFVNNFMKNTWK